MGGRTDTEDIAKGPADVNSESTRIFGADYFFDSACSYLDNVLLSLTLSGLDGVESLWICVSLTPLFHIYPQSSGSVEGIRDVLNFDRIGGDQDANDIELVRLADAPVAFDPDLGALA